MNWTELLKLETGYAFAITEKLVDMVSDSELGWKPPTGKNWMTVGQLLKHLAYSCGAGMKGFVTGDWGVPEGDMDPENMLPPAEKLPTVESVAEAKKQLAADKQTAFDILASCDERSLDTKPAPAPWDPREIILGHRLLQMVEHLNSHKSQLFYYLKLMGKPVNTGHLWGM